MEDSLIILLGWFGMFAPMAMGAAGSMIGCLRAGQTACGAMIDAEGGYGRFVGISAMPASQTIYGIVVMYAFLGNITPEGSGLPVVNAITAPALFGIGSLAGVALMISAIAQGLACAAAISTFKTKTEVFGLSIAPAAIVEGFAVFALVFALIQAGFIPPAVPEVTTPAG